MCREGPDRNQNPRPVDTVRVLTNPSPLARELEIILNLQRQAEAQQFRCNRNELGMTPQLNTRPFILYLPNGEPFSIRTDVASNFVPLNTNNPANGLSNSFDNSCNRAYIFRIEDLQGNRATLRALKYVLGKYILTCHCCIIDLSDFAALQPLNDTYVQLTC